MDAVEARAHIRQEVMSSLTFYAGTPPHEARGLVVIRTPLTQDMLEAAHIKLLYADGKVPTGGAVLISQFRMPGRHAIRHGWSVHMLGGELDPVRVWHEGAL